MRHEPADQDRVMQEINHGSERSVVLVIGAVIEDRLQSAIEQLLTHLTEDEKVDFFGENGPAGDFASRIKISYAMGAIPKWMRDDINIIREIRNAFAHSQLQISFDDKEVADLCLQFNRRKEADQFISHFDSFKMVGITIWVQIYDPRFWT